MDAQFQPGWKDGDRKWMYNEMETYTEHDDWVIDGNYTWYCYEGRVNKQSDYLSKLFSLELLV